MKLFLHTVGELVLRGVFLAPVLCFAYVSARMNLRFAETLGADDLTKHCFWYLGLAAAAYAALGLELARFNFKRGNPTKGWAAIAFLLLAAGYDAGMAYGLFSREHATLEMQRTDADRKKAGAEAAVVRLRADLAEYRTTPTESEASAALEGALSAVTESRCRISRLPDDERERCERLASARVAVPRARAKAALAAEVKTAEAAYNALPDAPPADARATTIGAWFVEWYPVALLQVGSLLGAYAAMFTKLPASSPAPVTPKPPAGRPAPAPSPPRTAPIATAGDVAKTVASLLHNPGTCPTGLAVHNGWLCGSQRQMAAALGVPVSRYNRDLRQAALAGVLEIDTSGRVTRVRLAAAGNA